MPYDSDDLGYYDDYILLDEVTIGTSTGGSRSVTVSVAGLEDAVGGYIAVLYDYGDLKEGQSFTPSKVTVRHMQLEVGEHATDWSPGVDDNDIEMIGDVNMRANAQDILGANTALSTIRSKDKNGEPVFYSQVFRTTGNGTYVSFIHRRYKGDGTYVNHGFYMNLDADCKPTVTFPTVASRNAWLEGLKLANSVVKTITDIITVKGNNATIVNDFNIFTMQRNIV